MMLFRLLGLLLILGNCNSFAHESRSDIITVNGQGSVFQAPDTLKFTIAVEEKGVDSAGLSDLVNAKTKQILKILADNKVPNKDIQAMSVSLHPWFERERQSNIQKGFVYSRNINVTLRDFSRYPNILDKLFKLDVTGIDSFRYEVDDQQSAYLLALEQALVDAKRRASKIAGISDLSLAGIVNVEELSNYRPSPQPSARSMAMFSDAAQYLPGLNEISASVAVSFNIQH
ncbi:SIMPL domain-containing protein [Aliiglaciecola sp. LCG003]|uniref:SIMPL domain-containing protein n=1 Tax=Aliiglaciecola sp. LCG003 TaxID=3053655 RepID=UPI0025747192|nr:SIMPL domain-containing protein [Aliiglaciecola sp. LCG003]WJG07663.1 SIMPL domain-containing protein [Aliiglaciecola sp. LCG003]